MPLAPCVHDQQMWEIYGRGRQALHTASDECGLAPHIAFVKIDVGGDGTGVCVLFLHCE